MMQITPYLLSLTETTRQQQSITFLEPQFITSVSAHEMRMMNVPISTCFYKRSRDFWVRPGTREQEHATGFCTELPKRCQIKSQAM